MCEKSFFISSWCNTSWWLCGDVGAMQSWYVFRFTENMLDGSLSNIFSFLSKLRWTVRYESKGLNCINLITDRASEKKNIISLENKIRFMTICRINDVWTEATYPYPMVVSRIACRIKIIDFCCCYRCRF